MFSKLQYSKSNKKRYQVTLSKFVEKRFERLPENIRRALRTWVLLIEEQGAQTMRKVSGYHDEPLKGDRKGQRSSRLNRSYRVIYEEYDSHEIIIISVLEVNKHEY